MPPVVGITTGFAVKGAPGAQVNASYLHAVQQAGGVPLVLPPQLSPEARDRLLATVDGLLLTGGGDVDPARYGAENVASLGVSEERDTLEVAAVLAALDRDVPILALCRGMQVLNVALGGTLHQHIPDALPHSRIAHAVPQPRDEPAHEVEVEPGSRLALLIGDGAIGVNSRHHQAVDRLGEGLVVTARAPDGVVEGLELPGRRFVLAVQWHPEDMTARFDSARALFEGLAKATEVRR